MKTLLVKRYVRLVIAFLVTGSLYALAFGLNWFPFVDHTVYDLGMALRSSPDSGPDVVLIEIDKRSQRECFPEPVFPISRHLHQHARLIERLDSAGAAFIVFDILFDRLENVEDSCLDRFRSSLEKSGNVVLASAVEYQNTRDAGGQKAISIERFCVPPERIRNVAAALGLINVPLDGDNRIRRACLRRQVSGEIMPSLALAAAGLFLGEDRESLESIEDTILIDYSLLTGGIVHIPCRIVLLEDGWQSYVRDKIALVGVTENGAIDHYKTPLSIISGASTARMPGVEIQVASLQTLLSGNGIMRPPKTAGFLGGLAVLIFLLWIISGARPLIGLLEAGGVALILILAAIIVMILAGTSISIAPLLFGIINGTVVMIALNMIGLRTEHDIQTRFVNDVKADLSSAHDIQAKLQPRQFPTSDKFDLAGIQIPCKAVGGDYYDIIELPGDRLGILIADVAGKGIGGSLIMSNIQGCFRQIAVESKSPGALFQKMNDVVKSAANVQHFFVTAIYAILDMKSGDLLYADAGHGLAVLCSGTGKTEFLEEGGVPLGILPDNKWTDHNVQMNPGDILCLYTDGISEATSQKSGKMFDNKGVIACLKKTYPNNAQSICENILAECQAFVGDADFDDDWTILVLKIK